MFDLERLPAFHLPGRTGTYSQLNKWKVGFLDLPVSHITVKRYTLLSSLTLVVTISLSLSATYNHASNKVVGP